VLTLYLLSWRTFLIATTSFVPWMVALTTVPKEPFPTTLSAKKVMLFAFMTTLSKSAGSLLVFSSLLFLVFLSLGSFDLGSSAWLIFILFKTPERAVASLVGGGLSDGFVDVVFFLLLRKGILLPLFFSFSSFLSLPLDLSLLKSSAPFPSPLTFFFEPKIFAAVTDRPTRASQTKLEPKFRLRSPMKRAVS